MNSRSNRVARQAAAARNSPWPTVVSRPMSHRAPLPSGSPASVAHRQSMSPSSVCLAASADRHALSSPDCTVRRSPSANRAFDILRDARVEDDVGEAVLLTPSHDILCDLLWRADQTMRGSSTSSAVRPGNSAACRRAAPSRSSLATAILETLTRSAGHKVRRYGIRSPAGRSFNKRSSSQDTMNERARPGVPGRALSCVTTGAILTRYASLPAILSAGSTMAPPSS